MNIINIYENFNSYFNADINLAAIFERFSKIAAKSGHKIYLIGGLVRDMLLSTTVVANPLWVKQSNQHSQAGKIASLYSVARNNVTFLDIDITVEGDAIEFANILENKAGAKIISTHPSFGTAKIEFDGQMIDLASTRSESYPKKGHLPHVDEIGCSLKKDVLRRDFTINSLAMSLNQGTFADLIDYTGGFEDLKLKKIRVLHEKSFIDDPTRIIRGLKYASRLGFKLDKNTLRLQEEYLKNINYDMGIKRVKQEFKKTFDDCKADTFDKFIDQKIYKLLVKHDVKSVKVENLITKYKPKHPWIVYFGVLIAGENFDRFDLTKSEKEIIEGAKCLLDKEVKNDFEIYKAFCALKLESLLILAALGKEKEVLKYLENLSKIRVLIKGEDLIRLGIKPSKQFSEIFDYVLRFKLKNPEINKSQEIKLVESFLKN